MQNKIAFGTRIPTLQERRASKKRAIRRSETSFANNTMAKPETLEAAEIKQQVSLQLIGVDHVPLQHVSGK